MVLILETKKLNPVGGDRRRDTVGVGVLPWWFSDKESTCQCRRHRSDPWVGTVPHVT